MKVGKQLHGNEPELQTCTNGQLAYQESPRSSEFHSMQYDIQNTDRVHSLSPTH